MARTIAKHWPWSASDFANGRPKLAIRDGSFGFWIALQQAYAFRAPGYKDQPGAPAPVLAKVTNI